MRRLIVAGAVVAMLVANIGCASGGKRVVGVDDAAFYPSGWSDDSAFAFGTMNRESSWQPVKIDIATGHHKVIDVGLSGAGVGDVQGSKLLIESVEPGGSDIYVFDMWSEVLRQLTHTDEYEWHPAFGPNGDIVVFDRQTENGPDIFTLDLSTGDVGQVTSQCASEQAAQFSPDGKYIAFHRRVDGSERDYDIVIRELRTGAEQSFARTNTEDSYPNWHPGGQHIVFTSNRQGDFDLLVGCRDSAEVLRLTKDSANEKYPKWSPDGLSILYQSDSGGTLALYQLRVTDLPKCN